MLLMRDISFLYELSAYLIYVKVGEIIFLKSFHSVFFYVFPLFLQKETTFVTSHLLSQSITPSKSEFFLIQEKNVLEEQILSIKG